MLPSSHRRARWVRVLEVLLILVPAGPALAGAPGPTAGAPVQVLGLQELIDRALATSPELGAAKSGVAAARSDLEQAKAGYYPQWELTGLAGPVNDAELPRVEDGRITDPSPSTSPSHTGVFGRLDLTATQPLYTFGKLSNRKEAAARGLEAAQLESEARKNQLALRVKALYFGLVLARGGADTAKQAQGFFDDARGRISRLLELDSPNVKESDLYRIDAYRADSARSLAEAEKGASFTYYALKALIGLGPEEAFRPADESLPEETAEPKDLAVYVNRALRDRPELRQLGKALEAKRLLAEAATSDLYPSFFLALEGSVARAPGRDHLDNAYIQDEFNHEYAGVVAGFRWNFDFGLGTARVDKARAEHNELRYAKASAEMGIPIQVAKSYLELREWRQAADAYRQAARASRKWVIAALADFDMGIGTADDMLNGIEKYGHNQGQYLEALYHYHLSLAELRAASGMKGWQVAGSE